MKCKFAPRYRVTIRSRGRGALYGIVGRRYDPLLGREVCCRLEDVAGDLRTAREVVWMLNERCVGLEWMERAAGEIVGAAFPLPLLPVLCYNHTTTRRDTNC